MVYPVVVPEVLGCVVTSATLHGSAPWGQKFHCLPREVAGSYNREKSGAVTHAAGRADDGPIIDEQPPDRIGVVCRQSACEMQVRGDRTVSRAAIRTDRDSASALAAAGIIQRARRAPTRQFTKAAAAFCAVAAGVPLVYLSLAPRSC